MLNHNNMPGAGSVADTLEFMKKMWSGAGAPAMGMPSLSVDEINQKIADLKAVASWLEMNMNMLRATIQTMEVQSATLSTLQAMGAILTPNPGAAGAAGAAAATPSFGFPAWPPQTAKTSEAAPNAASKKSEPEPEPDIDEDENFPMPPDTAATSHETGGEHSTGDAPIPDFQTAMGNPNAWWNLLQGQFTQAVGNALAEHNASQPEAKPKAAAKPKTKAAATPAAKAAPKTAAKPAARAKSTTVQSGNPKPASRKPRPS